MQFLQRWHDLTSFLVRRNRGKTIRRRPASMAVEALEDRVTPSGSSILSGGPTLSQLQNELIGLINDIPGNFPPITLPPGWNNGQPTSPIQGNGIIVGDPYFATATGQTLTASAQNGLLSLAYDFTSGSTIQVTQINGSAANLGTAVTLSSGATLTANADGSFTYVPAAGFTGDDSFTFTVSDGTNTTVATADITVTGAQIFLPNASFSTTPGQTLTVTAANGLLIGATDSSGNSLQVTGISAGGVLPSSYYWDSTQPLGGAFLNSVGATTLDHIYGRLVPGTLYLPGENTGAIGSPFTLPSGSTITVNADGSFTYVPAAGFTGDDTFSFTVSDGTVTATAVCDISVVGPQLNIPQAGYQATTGVALTENAANGLLSSAYDSTPGATVTVTAVNGTSLTNGTATVTLSSGATLTVSADGSFVYTPAAGFQGDDDFSFTASDGTLTTTDNGVFFVAAPLLIVPDFYYATSSTVGSLTVPAGSGLLANAYDSVGATLSVTAVNGTAIPAGGSATVTLASGSTLTVNSDGSFTYVPAAGVQGDDTFTFTASDGTTSTTNNSDIYVSAPQLLVPDAYFATATTVGSLTIPAGSALLAGAFDSSGATVTVTAVNGATIPAGGSATVTLASGSRLTVNSDGAFTYVPAAGFQGDDTFTFTASDGTISTVANGDINVSPPQLDVPNAYYTAASGQGLVVNRETGLLSGVFDTNYTPVSVTAVNGTAIPAGGSAIVTLASGGTLTVNADGSFVYFSAAGFQGDDAFTFTASDGTLTTKARADINVAPPQLDVFDASFTAGAGQTLNVNADNGLLAYVYDTSGNPLTITAVNGNAANVGTPITLSSGSTLTVNADGSFTYVPAAGYQGDDTFTFTVSDGLISAVGNGDVNVITPQITVSSPSYSTTTGQTLSANASTGLVSYAFDSVNNPMTVTAVNGSAANVGGPFTLSSGATVTVNADGSFTYVPVAGFTGSDSFAFTVGDGATTTDATATINVVTPQLTVPDRIYGGGGQTLTISASNGLLAWVQDPTPGATVTVTAVNGDTTAVGTATTLPSGATLTVNADGSFTYVPASSSSARGVIGDMANLFGSGDSFTFTVSDGTLSGTATATIFGKFVPIVLGSLPGGSLGIGPVVSTPLTTPTSVPPIFVGASDPNKLDYTLGFSAAPQDLTVRPNALVTLTAPTGSSVQWQMSSNGGITWSNLHQGPGVQTGANGNLTVAAGSSTSKDQYRAQVTEAPAGRLTQTTNPVSLTVAAPPSVAVQPSSLSVLAGKKVTLTATVKGAAATKVQWQVQSGPSGAWTNIEGAGSLTLSFTATAADNGNHYRIVVTNAAGTANSTPVTLTVKYQPTVTTQPINQSVTVGTKATFTATAAANPAPAIQWQVSANGGRSWLNLQNAPGVLGAHTGALTITATSQENGYQYRAVFTSPMAGNPTAVSKAAVITVQTPKPVVTVQPQSQTGVVNHYATFMAAATGATKIQWQVSTDDGVTWTNVRGATGKTLRLKAVAAMNGYEYRAAFSNAGGTTDTQAVTLTVEAK